MWIRLAPWLVAVAAIAGYVNTFGSPFIFDDEFINSLRPEGVWPLLRGIGPRWLVNLTFLLNYLADGRNPAGYHAATRACTSRWGFFFTASCAEPCSCLS